MNYKRFLLTFLVVAAQAAVETAVPKAAFADDGDEDKALAPLVMVLFDTSTSMDICMANGNEAPRYNDECWQHTNYADGCTDTRLTKAIAAIAGTPKGMMQDDGNPSPFPTLTKDNVMRPKQNWVCTANECHYETKLYKINPNQPAISNWDANVRRIPTNRDLACDADHESWRMCDPENAARYLKCENGTWMPASDRVCKDDKVCNPFYFGTSYEDVCVEKCTADVNACVEVDGVSMATQCQANGQVKRMECLLGCDGNSCKQCNSSSQCGDGMTCNHGECEPCDPTPVCDADGGGYTYCEGGTIKSHSCAGMCVEGECQPCRENDVKCSGSRQVVTCKNGVWTNATNCESGLICSLGMCMPPCVSGTKQCAGNGVQECVGGVWDEILPCGSGQYCNTDAECVAVEDDDIASTVNNRIFCTAKLDNRYLSEQDIANKNYSNAYNDDGVIQAYMYSVKFGFAGMAISKYNLYGHVNYKPYTGDKDNLILGRTIESPYKSTGNTNTNGYSVCSYYSIQNDQTFCFTSNYYILGNTDYNYPGTDSGSYYSGIRNANPNSGSPLLYPTVSDELKHIEAGNRAVIDSVRTYYPNANTPSGPALADMWYLFGGDSTTGKLSDKADPGMLKQYYHGISHDITTDSYYDCRPKAVIFITDGEPVLGIHNPSDGHGNRARIWEDARHLYEAGIKVYTVGFAQGFDHFCNESEMNRVRTYSDGVACSASLLNYVAWKGGTCRNPETREIIHPDDSATFYRVIYSGDNDSAQKVRNKCFYDASSSDALKNAMVDALSDMLSSFISKTRIATTSAIGLAKNYDSSQKIYNNGYYNVYSGYEVTLGQVRRTSLQRETFTCDHSTGEFQNDDKQYLDLAKRLQCRITECDVEEVTEEDNNGENKLTAKQSDMTKLLKETGYETEPTPCAPHGVSSSIEDADFQNTCITDRYIFAGNYSQDRYALAPQIVTMLDKAHDSLGSAKQDVLAGFIKDGRAKDSDYHFLVRDDRAGDTACAAQMSRAISSYTSSANYLLSPYECGSDFDCGMKDNKPRYCDLGRCVDDTTKCTSDTDDANNGKICIGGHEYKRNPDTSKCNSHGDCEGKCGTEGGCVCHAGYCVAGTVKGCDMRQFIATQPLGTIEYATPVPIVPPTRSYNNHSYKEFSKKYWQRDTLLLTGANDGMLHAFILGDNGGSDGYQSGLYAPEIEAPFEPEELNENEEDGVLPIVSHHGDIVPGDAIRPTPFAEGDELWGFIPKAVMPSLYKLTEFGPQRHVNATPVTADVRVPDHDGEEADSWRTVVVGGFRNGGRGYYALDVTNPGNPQILWEIDNQWQAALAPTEYPDMYAESAVDQAADWQNRSNHENGTGTWYPFQLLGQSYPEPVITNLVIQNKVEPVVIIAGGEPLTSNAGDRTGHVIYIVRLFPETKDDLLVKTFYFKNAITGTPAVFPNNFNSIAQLIYVGDSTGALFRLDLANPDIEMWGSNVTIDDTPQGSTESASYTFESPIFDPNDPVFGMGASGTNPVSYEKITYKPAVSAYQVAGVTRPTVQITFGSGSNDNFSINEGERNYVANFYDVYNGTNYQLNAIDEAFSPEVYVFNKTDVEEGLVSITSNDTYGNQQFTVWTHDPAQTESEKPFDPRQKMTGAAVTHNFVSYFPTFIADAGTQQACATGGAAIWKIGSPADGVKHGAIQAGIMNTTNDANLFQNTNMLRLSPGTKIYGLEITNQLYCLNTTTPNASQQVAPQLIAQTGAETTGIASSDGTNKLKPASTNIQSVAVNLEAIQPEMKQSAWANVYE